MPKGKSAAKIPRGMHKMPGGKMMSDKEMRERKGKKY